LFAFICFPHAKDVTDSATRGVANDNQSTCKQTIANQPNLAIVLPPVLNLQGHARENGGRISKIEPSLSQSLVALGLIKRYPHGLLYLQKPFESSCAPYMTAPHIASSKAGQVVRYF
jgi:hypothetical protein